MIGRIEAHARQWAEARATNDRISAIERNRLEAIELGIATDPKLFTGITNATPVAIVLWIVLAAAFWGAWVGSPS